MPQWTHTGWLRNWPRWIGYVAAFWSLCYGALGLYWTLGGAGYPFGPIQPRHASLSILEGAPVGVLAPIMAGIGLLGTIIALLMTRKPQATTSTHPNPAGAILIGFGWLQAITLAAFLPDYSLLGILAFSPVLLVFAFTGIPGGEQLSDILYWHRLNLVVLFIGGLLWAATTLAYQRRRRQHCAHCGRGDTPAARWTTPESARRWGRWAVYVAVVANVPYELTRVLWFFGVPIGITPEFEQKMASQPPVLEIGLSLALAGVGGAILIHGLSHRWGEVYPRWIWWRAGRPVPRAMAIVPATLVSLVLIPAGLMNCRVNTPSDMWATTGPGMLWVVWGLALGAATYAYHLRRRPACRHCHRGPAHPQPADLSIPTTSLN